MLLQLRSEGGDENELLARLCGCSLITLLPSASYSLKVSLHNVPLHS